MPLGEEPDQPEMRQELQDALNGLQNFDEVRAFNAKLAALAAKTLRVVSRPNGDIAYERASGFDGSVYAGIILRSTGYYLMFELDATGCCVETGPFPNIPEANEALTKTLLERGFRVIT